MNFLDIIYYVTMRKIIFDLIFKAFKKYLQFLFLEGFNILLQVIQNWSLLKKLVIPSEVPKHDSN